MWYHILLAHHIHMAPNDAIVVVHLPITQVVVDLVGRGVERGHLDIWIILIAVIVVEDGCLTNGHANDGATLLVGVSGATVTVSALWPEQDRGDVVDLMCSLSARTLLWNTATFAPPMTSVKNQSEEQNEKEKGNEASLENTHKRRILRI